MPSDREEKLLSALIESNSEIKLEHATFYECAQNEDGLILDPDDLEELERLAKIIYENEKALRTYGL